MHQLSVEHGRTITLDSFMSELHAKLVLCMIYGQIFLVVLPTSLHIGQTAIERGNTPLHLPDLICEQHLRLLGLLLTH